MLNDLTKWQENHIDNWIQFIMGYRRNATCVWKIPATIPRLVYVTYFLPGTCGGEFLSNFEAKIFVCTTLIPCNSFGWNKIKIMKTSVNRNTLKPSLLHKWRRDVLIQYFKTCKAKTCFLPFSHLGTPANVLTFMELLTVILTLPRVFIKTYGYTVLAFS